jgi:hypothetical protein
LHTNAVTITVNSVITLQTAINNANTGDTLMLSNGTYLNNTLTIGKSNVVIKAQTNGGVYLNGTNTISITSNNVVFSGFQFTSGTIAGNVILVSGNNNTLSQLNFNGYDAGHMIQISGQYNLVVFSNFQNKPAALPLVTHGGTGDMVQIIPNAVTPGYNTIRYCSFQKMPGFGGDYGNECIRIGDGIYSTFISRTIVEYCYFEDTGNGDSEAISVKSKENCLRFNTMKNNQNAMFSFRNGDNNVAYGNFFINAGGIKVKEANNIYCYNNYFDNAGISTVTDAVTFIYYTANTTNVLNNINFIHNTFYNCGFIDLGGVGATNNTWANNIFQKASGNIFKNANASTSWAGNMYQGTLGISISSGISNTNPLLSSNSDGYQGLSSSSPAINAANASYPAILDIPVIDDDPTLAYDISGQSRPSTLTLKDVGCDEYSPTNGPNHPLILTEVGPSYLGGPALPIKLISFDVFSQNNTAVISWSTSSEQNSNHFEIQKSTDGINFYTIGKVNAAGNSSSTIKYEFADLNTSKGLFYYRLKQIDLDGKLEFSNIKKINFSSISSIKIYPNPTNNNLNIIFSEMIIEKQNIRLYNLQGQLVKAFTINANSLANGLQSYNISDIENGIYLVQIISNTTKKEFKLVVQK